MNGLVDKVRSELDKRFNALGGELPGQYEAVKDLAYKNPNCSVNELADIIEERITRGDFQ